MVALILACVAFVAAVVAWVASASAVTRARHAEARVDALQRQLVYLFGRTQACITTLHHYVGSLEHDEQDALQRRVAACADATGDTVAEMIARMREGAAPPEPTQSDTLRRIRGAIGDGTVMHSNGEAWTPPTSGVSVKPPSDAPVD